MSEYPIGIVVGPCVCGSWPGGVCLRCQKRDPLAERAARLYPDNEALQQEWRRAVRVVRATEQGWVLERRVERRGA